MIEITERFLREIGDRVGTPNVESVHLFPPIRQGGVETGAAVVAASMPTHERHTVWSASYRHTLKGPDRGKWEVEVTPDAGRDEEGGGTVRAREAVSCRVPDYRRNRGPSLIVAAVLSSIPGK